MNNSSPNENSNSVLTPSGSFIPCMYCGNTGTVGGANCPVCRPGRDWRLM